MKEPRKYLNQQNVRRFVNGRNKQISAAALDELGRAIEGILSRAAGACGGAKRIRPFEIEYAIVGAKGVS